MSSGSDTSADLEQDDRPLLKVEDQRAEGAGEGERCQSQSQSQSQSHRQSQCATEATSRPHSFTFPTSLPNPERVNLKLYTAFVSLGVGAWVLVNSCFVELAVFAEDLPESWAIGADLSAAVQLGNIAPLAFIFVSYLLARFANRALSEVAVIAALVVLGVTVCILLSVFWRETSVFAGSEHSVALLVLVAIGSMIDCTTTIVFWPLAGAYSTVYTSAMAGGEGLGGLILGVLGIIQNPGPAPRFSVSLFFVLAAVLMVLCGAGLAYVWLSPVGVSDRKQAYIRRSSQEDAAAQTQHIADARGSLLVRVGPRLCLFVWLSFTQNGIIPSLLSYSCKPYDNGSLVLMYATTLRLVADPLACFFAAKFRNRSVYLQSLVWSTLTVYIVAVAAMSPLPPLIHDPSGGVLIVCVHVSNAALIAYNKTMLFITLQEGETDVNQAVGRRVLRYAGIAIQFGSFLGSGVFFLLVNVWNVFNEA